MLQFYVNSFRRKSWISLVEKGCGKVCGKCGKLIVINRYSISRRHPAPGRENPAFSPAGVHNSRKTGAVILSLSRFSSGKSWLTLEKRLKENTVGIFMCLEGYLTEKQVINGPLIPQYCPQTSSLEYLPGVRD